MKPGKGYRLHRSDRRYPGIPMSVDDGMCLLNFRWYHVRYSFLCHHQGSCWKGKEYFSGNIYRRIALCIQDYRKCNLRNIRQKIWGLLHGSLEGPCNGKIGGCMHFAGIRLSFLASLFDPAFFVCGNPNRWSRSMYLNSH